MPCVRITLLNLKRDSYLKFEYMVHRFLVILKFPMWILRTSSPFSKNMRNYRSGHIFKAIFFLFIIFTLFFALKIISNFKHISFFSFLKKRVNIIQNFCRFDQDLSFFVFNVIYHETLYKFFFQILVRISKKNHKYIEISSTEKHFCNFWPKFKNLTSTGTKLMI